jgi:hypothetical protein
METKLYVYTGTGNSLWIARQLALELRDATVQFIPILTSDLKVEAERVGIIFPVRILGLPSRVIQFISHLQAKPETYSFVMPSNYTPWGGPGPVDAQQRLFSKAQEKVKAIAGTIL